MSPKHRATTTTSTNDADANSANTAKLAPLPLARSTSDTEFDGGPAGASVNAIQRITGNATTRPNTTWVRRRRSCRTSSTRTGKVRLGT